MPRLKMKRFVSMESLRITSILVLLYTCSISSFPSRPLNERSADLAWQAWLLVDDQNQEKNYGAEVLGKKRITPKSVFIAPTFSPESLPPCASGYQSDTMGRCIKLIEIDQEAHLEFLLQKLNERFGGYDDFGNDDENDENSTEGPIQLNIPLDETINENSEFDEKIEENVNVAIVVTPTNGGLSFNENIDGNNDESEYDFRKVGKIIAEDFDEMKNVRNSDHKDLIVNSKTSPLTPDPRDFETAPMKLSTDSLESTVKTTIMDKNLDSITESSTITETNSNTEQALFFRNPTEPFLETTQTQTPLRNIEDTTSLTTSTFDQFTKPTATITTENTYSFEPTNFVPKSTQTTETDLPTSFYQNDLQLHSSTEHSVKPRVNFFNNNEPIQGFHVYAQRFKHVPTTQKYFLRPTENHNDNLNYFRDSSKYVRPRKMKDSTGDEEVVHEEKFLEDLKSRRSLGINPEDTDRLQINSSTKTRRNVEKGTNSRFLAPEDASNLRNPIIFRFPRKIGSRKLLSETINQPQKTLFRAISPEDLKVIFGNHRYKRKFSS